MLLVYLFFFFFFQAEDGIRDIGVTGVQTCALPISCPSFVQTPPPQFWGPPRPLPGPAARLEQSAVRLSTAVKRRAPSPITGLLRPWRDGERPGRTRMPAGGEATEAFPSDNVIDLLDWRAARRPERLPDAVLDEVEAAGRVYDALLAQGHEVRFELPGDDGGRVRAELRSLDGAFVRAVGLAEV